jgi:4-hydroxybenzoate polyprenyltransferase
VATVVAGAAYGYGVNEVADRVPDARAGKPNRAAGLPRRAWVSYVVLTGAAAVGLALTWAPDAAAPAAVLLGLGLAVAYSVPPIRLKERGVVGLLAAAAAQWTVPVLVVAAAEPGGRLRAAVWAFALLSLAIGTRWMAVHELLDAGADRASGVRTYASERGDVSALLRRAFACELLLLIAALAAAWPRSAPAALALVPYLAYEALRRSHGERLAGYDRAPLATYYFLALPLAVAVRVAVDGSDATTPIVVLVVLALPQLLARIRWWGGAGLAVKRASASAHRPVVRASEPHP